MFNLFKEYNNDFKGQCIYFLYLDGGLVYIGKTARLKKRIYQHRFRNELLFDKVYYIPVEKSIGMNRTEAMLIRFFQPIFNLKENPRYYHLDPLRKEYKFQ